MMSKELTYKNAGVDISRAERLLGTVREDVLSTRTRGSMGPVDGFGGYFDLAKTRMKDPILVSGTDGVGTKLKIAQLLGKHDTVGIDLVAMCVNDVLCSGAMPLFFLDYIACGKLEDRFYRALLKGIAGGCREAGCALIGGETAEMPGMYKKGEYDLAGFCVGAVERERMLKSSSVKKGDVLLGLASSGLHSNGYSLVRKLFSREELKKHGRLFLEPTRIYAAPVKALIRRYTVRAIAHITGGGINGNLERVLPGSLDAVVDRKSWKEPAVFGKIRKKARIEEEELYRTFNMGIGMILIVPARTAPAACRTLKETFAQDSFVMGRLVPGEGNVRFS